MEMIFKEKGLGSVFDRIQLYLVYVSRKTPTGREDPHEVFPSRLWNLTKASAHREVAVALRSVFDGRVEGSKVCELAVDREVCRTLHRRIGGRTLQTAVGIIRRQHCLPVAKLIEDQTVRRDLGSGIQPR